MAQKKYSVSYRSVGTGYGWTEEHDRLDEFESFIKENRNNYTTHLMVYDRTLKQFIFEKWGLEDSPRVDRLSAVNRDMRTTTRTRG